MARAAEYLQKFGAFTFSAITWYEVVRGLRASGATTKLQRFDEFSAHSIVLPVSQRVLDVAADLWVTARGRRHASFDADLLIAATALEHGADLATGNHQHFDWIPRLNVEDWRQPPALP